MQQWVDLPHLESSYFTQTGYPSVGCLGVPLMMTIGCVYTNFIASAEPSPNSYLYLYAYIKINLRTLTKLQFD